MKTVLINGSPHKNGSTFAALEEISKVLNKYDIQTKIFHIGNSPVRGCQACGSCKKLGKCIYDDDCCNEISALIRDSDALVIGSPVYFSGPNGALCAILDRVFYSSEAIYFAHKPAAAIVNCRRGGNAAAFDRLNKYFTISNMYQVGSQYWNMTYSTSPDKLAQDLEGLQTMRTLAHNIAFLLNSLEYAKEVVEPPIPEEKLRTNFIG